MKAAAIVSQLANILPQQTDKFTDDIALVSLTRSGTVMTAKCVKEHGLKPSDVIAITGCIEHVPITSISRSGVVGTLVTTTDHDLTNLIATTVKLSGSTEAEFNDTFTRLNVVNRRTITFTMADSGATSATGSPILEVGESSLRKYNGTYVVLDVTDPTTFTFTHSVTSLPNPEGTLVARIKPRISAGISIDRLAEAYTKQGENQYWLFVVLGTVIASKDRSIASDAVSNIQRNNFFRQQLIQAFTIYVFAPVKTEIAASQSRDNMEDVFPAICKSILFHSFDSNLYVGAQNPVQFVQHAVFEYNTALYIHAFAFQQMSDLAFEDTVGPDSDVAFRDLDFTLFPQLDGTGSLTGNIDLDDTEL